MTEFWRRQDLQQERTRIVGRTNRGSHGYVLRETAFGRVVDRATFECEPCSGARERVRLWITVRDGVRIFNRGYVPTMQRIEEKRSDNCIALGARGGHQDHYYTWVQIFSEETE